MYTIQLETQSVCKWMLSQREKLAFLGHTKTADERTKRVEKLLFRLFFFACRASACTGAPQYSWLTTTTTKQYYSEWGIFKTKNAHVLHNSEIFFSSFTLTQLYFSLIFFFISFQKTQQPSDEKKNYNSSREVRVCVNQLVRLRKLNVKKRIYKKNKHGETRSEIMASRYVWLFILLTRIIHSVRFSTYSHNFAFFRIYNIICLRILCV